MKDLGETSFVLGIQILRDRSQGILRRHPIAKKDKFSLKQCPNNDLERNEMQKIPYASAVGSLMYLSDPGMQHWKVVKCVMRYLRRAKGHMLTYRKSEDLEIIGTLTPILQDVKTANTQHLDTSTC
ncbi:hypothetical protein CR513_16000, partial [Mucuna pruriens]